MDVAIMSRPTEFKAGLPEDFSGKNDDATHWLLAMKAYFVINEKIYTEDATTILIFLNKLSKGRGATFAEGWYMKLANPRIPDSEKTFKMLCKAFEEAFVPKDLKDRARQTVYSLSVTILFPHRSVLLFIHTRCLLTWRGRCLYTNTSYLFIRTLSSFCFFDLSMDLANS